MLLKLYCNLRIIPIAFATKHGSLAILRMSDPRTLLQPCLPGRSLDLQLRPRDLLSPRRKEARNVVHRLTRSSRLAHISRAVVHTWQSRRPHASPPAALVLIFIAVVPLALLDVGLAESFSLRIRRRVSPAIAGPRKLWPRCRTP